jgi:hypothetical protein
MTSQLWHDTSRAPVRATLSVAGGATEDPHLIRSWVERGRSWSVRRARRRGRTLNGGCGRRGCCTSLLYACPNLRLALGVQVRWMLVRGHLQHARM